MPWMEKRMQVVQITMTYFWSPAVRVWGPKVIVEITTRNIIFA